MTPRYEPRQISGSATITWRSQVLVTASSNSTSSSGVADEKASSNAARALYVCWWTNLRLIPCRAARSLTVSEPANAWMARSLRSLSGSGLTAAPTPRSILAPPVKARRCHHPSRQRQPSFACDPVSNHALGPKAPPGPGGRGSHRAAPSVHFHAESRVSGTPDPASPVWRTSDGHRGGPASGNAGDALEVG